MNFPFLSAIIFTPLLAAVLILLMPKERKTEVRMLAAASAFIVLVLSIYVYVAYNKTLGGFQFVEQVSWVPSLGIGYHVGADGIALPMVLLTGIVIFTGTLVSWGIEDRPREFFAFLLMLVGGVFGVFVSMDLFLLFFFYELAIFPMYLLIAV
jgi:NADH-quinone oxidoreductase subunit M